MTSRRIIHAALFTPGLDGFWGLPVLFWGSPGVGKTSVIREACRAAGLRCEVLSPGERGEGAFGVVPVPSADGTVLNYPPPDWARPLDAEGGVVFCDELTTAPPALQPPLLGLFLARRIGGFQFCSRVRVLAAANPVDEAASGYEQPLPLANREVHVQWDAGGVEEWASWVVGSSSEADAPLRALVEEERVMAAWPSAEARAKGLIVGFLRRRPELLHQQPKPEDPRASRAWPSRRTWEMAVRAEASSHVHGLSDSERATLIAGCVGEAACAEFIVHERTMDLPDPAELLDGKAEWKPDPKRLDASAAVLASCTALVLPAKAEKRAERAKALGVLFSRVAETAPDVAIPSFRPFLKSCYALAREECRPALVKLSPVMDLAGMLPGGKA
jgi:hypothetical protein